VLEEMVPEVGGAAHCRHYPAYGRKAGTFWYLAALGDVQTGAHPAQRHPALEALPGTPVPGQHPVG